MATKKKKPGIGFAATPNAANSAHNSESPKEPKAPHLAAYRWPKGVSGNPKGRPKETPFTTALKELADANPESVRAIAETMFDAAKNGVPFCNPVLAAKFITERIEGKPVQPISGVDGGPVKIEYGSREHNATKLRELVARASERVKRRGTK